MIKWVLLSFLTLLGFVLFSIGWGFNILAPNKVTNSIGMSFVRIPAGTVQIGPPSDEDDFYAYSRQKRMTKVDSFYIGTYEVTQAQYETIMGENPSYFRGDRIAIRDHTGHAINFLAHLNYPVENVSWDHAIEFCRRLSERPQEVEAGRYYTLPTEIQWEYACRAGSRDPYSFGDNPKHLAEFAWFRDNSLGLTHPVGKKKRNAWGLYDMHGNVSEWCLDSYPFPEQETDDQATAFNKTDLRIYRGGNWYVEAELCRADARDWEHRSYKLAMGFRVAMLLKK
jgi:formylglycine-generating enzyme required for sulfatase activity